jgi:cell division control protein 6
MSGKNLFSRFGKENTIFLDESCLYPDFIPDKLPGRESELESIAYCFRPLLENRKPINVFLVGPTGVGKTVCARYVLSQLEETNSRVKSIYLNCFEYNSRSSVLIALANFVGAALPRRGFGTDEIFSKLLEFLPKSSYTPIVVLDEVDQLVASVEGEKLLYDLVRLFEYGANFIGVILISNDVSLISHLDSRIRSSLAGHVVNFEPYSPSQLKSILSNRASLAFCSGVLEPDVIGVAAAHAAKLGGDCRIAIESLLRAGRIAESKNSPRVSLSHLKLAFEQVDSASLVKGLKHLSSDEFVIVKIISNNQPITSGKIYEIYSKKFNGKLKERRLREILSSLERRNFISSKNISLGHKGNTREFVSRIPRGVL